MRKEDCLFCKIVAGEIPSAKVYEDDRVLAFEDVNPQMPVHTLIVPRITTTTSETASPTTEMGYLFNTVKKICRAQGHRREWLPRDRQHERRCAAVRASYPRARAGRRSHELGRSFGEVIF